MKNHTGIINTQQQHTRRGGSLRRALFSVAALATLAFPATQAKALITVSDVVIEEASFSFRFTGSFPEWPSNGIVPEVLFAYASSDDILLKPFIDFCTENPQYAAWYLADVNITGTIAGIPFNHQMAGILGSGYTDLSNVDLYATGGIWNFGLIEGISIDWSSHVGEAVDLTYTLDWSGVEDLLGVSIFDTSWTGTLTFAWGINDSFSGEYPLYPESNAVILGTYSAVPEPATYAALAGLALLAWVAMRRSRDAHR